MSAFSKSRSAYGRRHRYRAPGPFRICLWNLLMAFVSRLAARLTFDTYLGAFSVIG